jgi:hypothetical protein
MTNVGKIDKKELHAEQNRAIGSSPKKMSGSVET